MISPVVLSVKKKSLRMGDDNNLTFKAISKNLDEYQEAIKEYEAEDAQKKDMLTGMDNLVKKMLKSMYITLANHSYRYHGLTGHPG